MKLTNHDDVEQLLRRCCNAGTPAMIVSNRLAVIAQGRFVELRPQELVLQIHGVDDLVTEPGAPETCSVSFCYAAIPYIFMVPLRSLRAAEAPAPAGAVWSTFARPAEVALIERRKSFRVPVGPDSGLTARLGVGPRWRSCVPHNISLHGMLLELSETEADAELDEGQRFALELTHAGQLLTLDATIYRRRGRYCAAAFPEVLRPGGGSVRGEMRELVELLKARWLRGEIPKPPPVSLAGASELITEPAAQGDDGARRSVEILPEALELQRVLLAAIEQCAFSVELLDPAARLLHANAAFEALTGVTRAQVLGQHVGQALAPDSEAAQQYERAVQTALAGERWSGSMAARSSGSGVSNYHVTVTPVHDATGKVTHLLLLRRDDLN